VAGPDTQELRNREAIRAVLQELKKRQKMLDANPAIDQELSGYLSVQKLLPELLSADSRESVNQAQKALYELQGRLDRVAAIHFSVRKVLRGLSRLEVLVKRDLADAGVIAQKTSKPQTEVVISLTVHELTMYQSRWGHMEKLCIAVQKHLTDARENLAVQMKLDHNWQWSQRRSV